MDYMRRHAITVLDKHPAFSRLTADDAAEAVTGFLRAWYKAEMPGTLHSYADEWWDGWAGAYWILVPCAREFEQEHSR
jgi:hypothetical protein